VGTVEDVAVIDTTVLVLRLAGVVEAEGGSLADLRRELETVWLKCAYAQDSAGGDVKLLERSPVSGEAALVAELESARDALIQVQRAAEINVAAARGAVLVAQGRMDEFRRSLVREHVEAWRQRAGVLRQRAVEAGDETTIVAVAVQGVLDGARMEPRLEYVRNLLQAEADQADQTTSWLEGYLARGDSLAGESLALLVSQLEPLPTA
jgi:hypothetical protein